VATHAVTQLHLTPAQALSACTVNAAFVVGAPDVGRIGPGYAGVLALLDAPDWRYLAYHLGGDLVATVIEGGEVAWRRAAERSERIGPR
jgi:imidazolonepropionase